MARYKLINIHGWRSYGIGFEIDTERLINGISIDQAKSYVRNFPDDWELVSEEKLPEKWCILRTTHNASVINEWNNNLKRIGESFRDEAWAINCGDYFYPDKSHNNKYDSSYTEITFDQFKKLVLKEESMKEKEIIGYKLKPDCKKYSIAAFQICTGRFNKTGIIGNVQTISDIEKLRDAGVLDLWFEPIYKQTYPDITINGCKGEFFDDYVTFGCAEISHKYFCEIYNLIFKAPKGAETNREIESVTIGKGTFTKEQIKEIAEYYLNKK